MQYQHVYCIMEEGILYIADFIPEPHTLFDSLVTSVIWDESMAARKTASFGKAYNYSQIKYPYQALLPQLETVNKKLAETLGFTPNNCLINFYQDGKSKMGYHADQIDILEKDTGIAIVSLGETRKLKFRSISNQEEFITYELQSGSLIYMTQEIQQQWQHAIPPSKTALGRISLTFRQIK